MTTSTGHSQSSLWLNPWIVWYWSHPWPRYERHIVFPKVLAQNCDDFNCNNTIYNADQVCHPCLSARNCLNQHCQCSYHHPFLGRRKVGLWDAIWHPISLTRWKYWMLWTKKKCPQVNTYTIEVSMLGYEDHDSRQIVPYTDDLYAKVSSKFQSWPGFPGWAEHNASLLGLLQDCGRHSAGGWWNAWQCDRANSTTPPNNWWQITFVLYRFFF